MTEKIGFVGLGNIGKPMAITLMGKVGPISVFDIDSARVASVVAAGARGAASLADLARGATLILLSLPTSNEVKKVVLGAGGLFSAAASGTLIVDLTSGNPPRSQAIAASLAEKGIRYIDAGVSGGVGGAAAGTLGIMIGGADDDVARARPVLEAIGKTLVHLGPVGAGHLTKSLNNLLLASNMVATSEALALAVKAGLDAGKVVAAINGSSGRSWVSEHRFPKFVLKGEYSSSSGMAMRLIVKDVAIACETAKGKDVTLFVGNLIHQLLMRISNEVGHDAPNSSVAKAIEDWAGVKIRAANDA